MKNCYIKLSIGALVLCLPYVAQADEYEDECTCSQVCSQLIDRGAQSQDLDDQALSIVKEFLDEKAYPDRSFAYYANKLIRLLSGEPRYKTFCAALNTYKHSKDPLLLGIYLKSYQTLIPEKVRKFILSKNQPDLIKILKKRMALN